MPASGTGRRATASPIRNVARLPSRIGGSTASRISGRGHVNFRRSRIRARLRARRDRLRRRVDQLDHRASPRATRACRKSPPPSRQARKAYLNRQYTTIGIVGVILFVDHLAVRSAGRTAVGFADRRGPLRARRLHRHERVGARQRAHRGSRAHGPQRGAGGRVPRRRDHRHAGRRPRPARRRRLLLVPDRLGALGAEPERKACTHASSRWSASPSAAR